MKWFVEEKHCTSGHWMPALYRGKPEISKDMRIKKSGGIGPRARNHPVEIKDEDLQLPLHVLQRLYGKGPSN